MTALQALSERPKGVVNPAAARKAFRLARVEPAVDLAPFVDYFWIVDWQLPDGATHVQRTLPYPCVNLVFDAGRTAIFGVMTGAFEYTLTGSGRVLGVRFRPGAFRGFLKTKVQSITDREIALSQVFDCGDAEAERQVLSADGDAGMIAAASAVLRTALPAQDAAVERIGAILAVIKERPDITHVQALAEQMGISVRRLQLLFAEHVGVSPKWVIRRNRLHDAADQLAHGEQLDLASLAQALGYFDQAHFTVDFERLVGRPPADYRRSCQRAAGDRG